MRYTKFNTRHERAENRKIKLAESLKGEGVYVFQNNTKGDLQLPKTPIKGGVRVGNLTLIPLGGKFEGDNYFMSMVRNNELRLIETLITPEQQRINMEEKLLLNQPDRVTTKGTVEHVIPNTKKDIINEDQPTKPNPEVLINEDPLSGVEILLS